MNYNTFYPLRRIASQPLSLLHEKDSIVKILYMSETAKQLDLKIIPFHNTSLADTVHPIDYQDLLPHINANEVIPGAGMGDLPAFPSPLFPNNSFLSLFGKTKQTSDANLSRKLHIKMMIFLDNKSYLEQYGRNPLVGGICFKGYPYLPFSINSAGENVSNFGLPREIRMTCVSGTGLQSDYRDIGLEFIDQEITTVEQKIISHSGFNFICCDPVTASAIIIDFSDFPLFNYDYKVDKFSVKVKRVYGFLVPNFHVFEYEETTRYRTLVPTGFLGAAKNNSPATSSKVEWSFACKRQDGVIEYFSYTAASIFGQQRTYSIDESNHIVSDDFNLLQPEENEYKVPKPGKKPKPKVSEFRECFISKKLSKNDSVTLFFEQAEEYLRCISGIKLFMPFVPLKDLVNDIENLKKALALILPDSMINLLSSIETMPPSEIEKIIETVLRIPHIVKFCSSINIKIYEVDVTEGVSPVNVKLDGKYSVLLAEAEIDDLSEIFLSFLLDGIKFRKTSSSKYYAIKFTNSGTKSGQVVVQNLKFIQSAHVSISSRAAYTQRVKNLQFRIIGPELASDYSMLGIEGFNFCIERVTAGQRGVVLYRANSLMDLLHTGAAKIFSNVRRPAIEEEITNVIGGEADNFEYRNSNSRGAGWRRTETGDGVAGDPTWTGINTPGQFQSFSNNESRSHIELLSPQEDVPEWKANAFIENAINFAFETGSGFMNSVNSLSNNPSHLENAFLGSAQELVPTYDNVKLFVGFENIWKGIANNSNKNTLKIKGVKILSSSPFGFSKIGKNVFELLDAIRNQDFAAMAINFLDVFSPLTADPRFFLALNCINSLGLSVSVQPVGLGVTFSASGSGNQLLPSLSFSNSFGTQGSIAKQASKTGYSYSQYLNNSYDESGNDSRILYGRSRRTIERQNVEGTERIRVKGAEVMWQGQIADIITGSIPLNFDLPATASKMYFRTSDDSLRVRLGSGVGKSITVDFWFEIDEEVVKDDY